MTGWIRLTSAENYVPPIYICVDHIQAVYARDEHLSAHIDMITGQYDVIESTDEVLQKIRLARPTRD